MYKRQVDYKYIISYILRYIVYVVVVVVVVVVVCKLLGVSGEIRVERAAPETVVQHIVGGPQSIPHTNIGLEKERASNKSMPGQALLLYSSSVVLKNPKATTRLTTLAWARHSHCILYSSTSWAGQETQKVSDGHNSPLPTSFLSPKASLHSYNGAAQAPS